METRENEQASRTRGRSEGRSALTLVEVLVVIAIVTLLMAMLFPALSAARESSRSSACQSNLRQIGVGLSSHAMSHGALCSGAFDWRNDGCVTEKGWVADLVAQGTPVGQMLCRSNPAQISETFNDLASMDANLDNCVDRLGSVPQTMIDGSLVTNPCRAIATMAPSSQARIDIISQQIYDKHYNTNYTPSWFLVRCGVVLDDSGNLKTDTAACAASLTSRHSTLGPLHPAHAENNPAAPSSFVPLMGCGATSGTLAVDIASLSGKPTVRSMTRGPLLKATLQVPSFPAGTSRTGPNGWWKVWEKDALQDYRDFAPVHRGLCNVLFADGSVRSLTDTNKDTLLNNGFPPASGGGFADDTVEVPPDQFFSGWSLRAR